MRRLAYWLLLAYVFTIPWEYSLDLGEPWGNAARICGLALLAVAVPAILHREQLLPITWMHILTLALFAWFCLSAIWSIELTITLTKVRAFFQEMMVLFLAWELARAPRDLRALLRAVVAGSWVLALLTLAEYRSVEVIAEGQLRAAAYGQDPNDVARFLALGMPLAALLGRCDTVRAVRWTARGYLPLALAASLLTASRGGVLAALIAACGCAVLLLRHRPRLLRIALLAAPVFAIALWMLVPAAALDRLATIPAQLWGGNLNERVNIWAAGWAAFTRAPLLGYGAGNFTLAAGVRPEDTAHNTPLALLAAGGLVALLLATGLAALVFRAAWKLPGSLRTAWLTALAVLAATAMVASVEENRWTWLLVALLALAERLAGTAPRELAASLPDEPGRLCAATQPAFRIP